MTDLRLPWLHYIDPYYPHCVPGSGRLFTPVKGLTLEL